MTDARIPDEWVEHHTAEVPLALHLPPSLTARRPLEGTVLVAVDTSLAGEFQPSVNVVAHPLDGLDPQTWQDQSDELLTARLQPQVRVDVEAAVRGRFRRTVLYYEVAAHGGVAMEQYATVEHDLAVTITCTCSVLEYPGLAPGFELIASSLRWEASL